MRTQGSILGWVSGWDTPPGGWDTRKHTGVGGGGWGPSGYPGWVGTQGSMVGGNPRKHTGMLKGDPRKYTGVFKGPKVKVQAGLKNV